MTDKPISPLRQRMIEDMTARHFAEKAQTDYIRYVKSFAAFLGRSPDTASAEDLRLFQQHMTKTHVSPWVINATVVALRFFFKVTLERDDLVRRLTLVSEPRRVPIVLSPEEVARLLTAAPGVKYRAALGVAYGASERTWVYFKLFGLAVLTFAFVMLQVLWLSRAAPAKQIFKSLCQSMREIGFGIAKRPEQH